MQLHTCRCHRYLFTVERGDFAPLMGRVVEALQRAAAHAANEHQVDTGTIGLSSHKHAR